MSFTKINGEPNLIRDTRTNSILNTNNEEYSRYLNVTKIKQEEKSKVESIEQELNIIKEDINQVKNLLQQLLNSCSPN
jgi:hypothetical protein